MYSHHPSTASPIILMDFFCPSWVLKKNAYSIYNTITLKLINMATKLYSVSFNGIAQFPYHLILIVVYRNR